jgi:hypothetical protein
MPKEKKERKKSEGRKPSLAPFVDSSFTIYMTTGKKEYKGTVLSSGVIRVDEKDFTSPSSAGSYILGKDDKGKPKQVDGWKSWTFNKDGERVALNTLRGSKSPLKFAEAKTKKPRAAKPAKAKTARKPRAKKAKTNGAEIQTVEAISVEQASAQ